MHTANNSMRLSRESTESFGGEDEVRGPCLETFAVPERERTIICIQGLCFTVFRVFLESSPLEDVLVP